jgi:HEAT repeat protein
MNQLLEWLSGGTLQSDGLAAQVGELVSQQPQLLDELLAGLEAPEPVVRGRAADALERVARLYPERFLDHLTGLITLAKSDPVAMVRWHLAMLLADLVMFEAAAAPVQSTLQQLLRDESAFVRSWAISGLCLLGRRYPRRRRRILARLEPLRNDDSIAVRHRVQKAIALLLDEQRPLPPGWVKSARSGETPPDE